MKRLAQLGSRGVSGGDVKMACKMLKIEPQHLEVKTLEDFMRKHRGLNPEQAKIEHDFHEKRREYKLHQLSDYIKAVQVKSRNMNQKGMLGES